MDMCEGKHAYGFIGIHVGNTIPRKTCKGTLLSLSAAASSFHPIDIPCKLFDKLTRYGSKLTV